MSPEQVAARPAATASRIALLERHAKRRGVMPPLHSRDEDETYYVLGGELTFFVGADVVRAESGDVVDAPRHVPRTYRVESDGARWLVLTRVASVARFEDFGRAVAVPVAAPDEAWPGDDEAAGLAAIAAANAISVLGPPGMLPSDL